MEILDHLLEWRGIAFDCVRDWVLLPVLRFVSDYPIFFNTLAIVLVANIKDWNRPGRFPLDDLPARYARPPSTPVFVFRVREVDFRGEGGLAG
ncbi:hypothetical protein WDW86_20175 [Bdellovibrionota bacterium FG-2]